MQFWYTVVQQLRIILFNWSELRASVSCVAFQHFSFNGARSIMFAIAKLLLYALCIREWLNWCTPVQLFFLRCRTVPIQIVKFHAVNVLIMSAHIWLVLDIFGYLREQRKCCIFSYYRLTIACTLNMTTHSRRHWLNSSFAVMLQYPISFIRRQVWKVGQMSPVIIPLLQSQLSPKIHHFPTCKPSSIIMPIFTNVFKQKQC